MKQVTLIDPKAFEEHFGNQAGPVLEAAQATLDASEAKEATIGEWGDGHVIVRLGPPVDEDVRLEPGV
jgi:hypothetical protein